jgi:excisionase family DNA binding protein
MTEAKNWEDLPLTLTAEDAAEILRVNPKVVRQMCRDGELPANKVGRAWRIDREAVRAYIHGRRWRPDAQESTQNASEQN